MMPLVLAISYPLSLPWQHIPIKHTTKITIKTPPSDNITIPNDESFVSIAAGFPGVVVAGIAVLLPLTEGTTVYVDDGKMPFVDVVGIVLFGIGVKVVVG